MLRMGEMPSKKEIDDKLKSSLDLLYHHDSFLLTNDLDELTISHKLASYLQQKFDAWNVDCEYNREQGGSKRLNGNIVRPDIIIHHRGTKDNLLVIEIKKMTGTPENDTSDFSKLKKFKEQKGYKYAVFLKIGTGSDNSGNYSFQHI